MGKIKRERQKFHISVANKEEQQHQQRVTRGAKLQLDKVENIFAGINIQIDSINKLDDIPIKPPSKTIEKEEDNAKNEVEKPLPKKVQFDVGPKEPEKRLTKKEKMNLRHEMLMEKLDATKKARMQNQQKKKKKNETNTLLQSKLEVQSMLTPAAVKPLVPSVNKNVFRLPSFNDDLPAFDAALALKPIQNQVDSQKISSKSKSITKKGNSNKNFVKNYNFLRKAMSKKKN